MKRLLQFSLLSFFALAACTETEYVEVIKTVHDTVPGPVKFVDRIFNHTDSVEIPGETISVPVPGPVHDSIIYVQGPPQIRVDSFFTVIHDRDTIVERKYGDTLIKTIGWSTYYVPKELQPYVSWYLQECGRRGLTPDLLDELVIMRVPMDKVLPSFSIDYYGQYTIFLNDNLTTDEAFIPICRELARDVLRKQYSQNVDDIMYMFFPPTKIRWSNKNQFTSEIDKLFQK